MTCLLGPATAFFAPLPLAFGAGFASIIDSSGLIRAHGTKRDLRVVFALCRALASRGGKFAHLAPSFLRFNGG